jgi:hypothetical protein
MLLQLRDSLNLGQVVRVTTNSKKTDSLKTYVLWKIDNKIEIKNFLSILKKENLLPYILVPRVKLKIYQIDYCLKNNLTYESYNSFVLNND